MQQHEKWLVLAILALVCARSSYRMYCILEDLEQIRASSSQMEPWSLVSHQIRSDQIRGHNATQRNAFWFHPARHRPLPRWRLAAGGWLPCTPSSHTDLRAAARPRWTGLASDLCRLPAAGSLALLGARPCSCLSSPLRGGSPVAVWRLESRALTAVLLLAREAGSRSRSAILHVPDSSATILVLLYGVRIRLTNEPCSSHVSFSSLQCPSYLSFFLFSYG